METLGTLELKISRLQQYLTVLASRKALSDPYPHHQAALAQEAQQVKVQLVDLCRRRDTLRRLTSLRPVSVVQSGQSTTASSGADYVKKS